MTNSAEYVKYIIMVKNRRRNLIVNRLQYRMLLHAFGIVVVVSMFMVISFYLLFGCGNSFTPGRGNFVNISLFIIIAIVLYYIVFITILRLSNRIYGPLYRLANYLHKLSEGIETGEIRFRKDDVVDGIQDIYNELCRSLTKTLHYDYKELAIIFKQLEDILDRMHGKNIDEQELYHSLEEICSRLAKALDITTEVLHQKKEE